MAGTKQQRSGATEREGSRWEKAVRRIAYCEGSAMQWNGVSGVRAYRADADAQPDTHDPDEEPRRICIGEVCEPLS